MNFKKAQFSILFLSLVTFTFGQNKNYRSVYSIPDVSKYADLSCLIDSSEEKFLKKIEIVFTKNSCKTIITNFSLDSIPALDTTDFYIKEAEKPFLLTGIGNQILYQSISKKTAYHSICEILYFKIVGLTFVGYSIDNLSVIESLRSLIMDNTDGPKKSEVIKYIDSFILSNSDGRR